MSLTIQNKSVVSIHYKLQDNDGNLLDSSENKDPMKYLHGAQNIVPGLENALEGKKAGDTFQIKVTPEEGYGEVQPNLIGVIPRDTFKGVDKIEKGMNFQAEAPDGSVQHIFVKEVNGDDITVDGNHPLAGVELNFDIEVIEVRDATEEEVSHGHVH